MLNARTSSSSVALNSEKSGMERRRDRSICGSMGKIVQRIELPHPAKIDGSARRKRFERLLHKHRGAPAGNMIALRRCAGPDAFEERAVLLEIAEFFLIVERLRLHAVVEDGALETIKEMHRLLPFEELKRKFRYERRMS